MPSLKKVRDWSGGPVVLKLGDGRLRVFLFTRENPVPCHLRCGAGRLSTGLTLLAGSARTRHPPEIFWADYRPQPGSEDAGRRHFFENNGSSPRASPRPALLIDAASAEFFQEADFRCFRRWATSWTATMARPKRSFSRRAGMLP